MARSWEQFKQKEHRASVEQCLADPEKLTAFNEIDNEGKVKNELYRGLLASKWLSGVTHLLATGSPEAGTEDFISHTQVEVTFKTEDLPEAKERFGGKAMITLFDYLKTLLP